MTLEVRTKSTIKKSKAQRHEQQMKLSLLQFDSSSAGTNCCSTQPALPDHDAFPSQHSEAHFPTSKGRDPTSWVPSSSYNLSLNVWGLRCRRNKLFLSPKLQVQSALTPFPRSTSQPCMLHQIPEISFDRGRPDDMLWWDLCVSFDDRVTLEKMSEVWMKAFWGGANASSRRASSLHLSLLVRSKHL